MSVYASTVTVTNKSLYHWLPFESPPGVRGMRVTFVKNLSTTRFPLCKFESDIRSLGKCA